MITISFCRKYTKQRTKNSVVVDLKALVVDPDYEKSDAANVHRDQLYYNVAMDLCKEVIEDSSSDTQMEKFQNFAKEKYQDIHEEGLKLMKDNLVKQFHAHNTEKLPE